jgi:Zn-dependent M28 family amino/carboxypeptidase
VFALGAERSRGTFEHVLALKRAESGLIVRPADAEIVPPLSDYEPFWERGVPFLFLSAGRSRVYHTPEDTPDKLDYAKIAATARWLTRFVRETRVRESIDYVHARLDRGTLDEIGEILQSLATLTPEASRPLRDVERLRRACDRNGNLPSELRDQLGMIVMMLEARLQ